MLITKQAIKRALSNTRCSTTVGAVQYSFVSRSNLAMVVGVYGV